jgi:hypothetical protein
LAKFTIKAAPKRESSLWGRVLSPELPRSMLN